MLGSGVVGGLSSDGSETHRAENTEGKIQITFRGFCKYFGWGGLVNGFGINLRQMDPFIISILPFQMDTNPNHSYNTYLHNPEFYVVSVLLITCCTIITCNLVT